MSVKKCDELNCENFMLARGLCRKHYYAKKKAKLLDVIQPHNKTRQPCKADYCSNISFTYGLCIKHYKRIKRGGPLEPINNPIDKSNWTPENIAWVAGIIEGEGNFNLRDSGKAARIRVRMTDFDVIAKLKEITKCGKIYGPYKRNNPKWKDSWDWCVYIKREFYELSKQILPWLLSRRKTKLLEILDILQNSKTRYNNENLFKEN